MLAYPNRGITIAVRRNHLVYRWVCHASSSYVDDRISACGAPSTTGMSMNFKRSGTVRRKTTSARALFEPLEARRFLSAVTLNNGTGDGAISVKVDAYGHYGTASGQGGDLTYDPA